MDYVNDARKAHGVLPLGGGGLFGSQNFFEGVGVFFILRGGVHLGVLTKIDREGGIQL